MKLGSDAMIDAISMDAACRSGSLLTRGPLNDTYAVELDGDLFFVRRRTVHDLEYGQSFAAERYVPWGLIPQIRAPKLTCVVSSESGQEEFAVFPFIHGLRPCGVGANELHEVVNALGAIHSVAASGFGPVGATLSPNSAPDFLYALVDAELERLAAVCVPPTELLGLRSALPAAVEVFDGEAPCLTHGDVHPGNFSWDDGNTLWVVDWEAARYRVAAADFNQMTIDWLDKVTFDAVVVRYCELTDRDPVRFRCQVQLLQLLWLLRTHNFERLVLARPRSATDRWVHMAAALAAETFTNS